jgi:diaminohydroxyphosphoribosylaminopyrimidine deaminase/5-amino-6-(5-phosphoribosylamino)uracil reductase
MAKASDVSDQQYQNDDALWPLLLQRAAGQDIVRPVDMNDGGAFWNLYAPIADGNSRRPFVVAQLGQSLDGRIATPTGCSRYINGPEALRHLHRLRALVDVVVVGIGTVIADDPQLNVRLTEGRHPARVVIDPNGRLPPDARMLADDGCPVFVIQTSECPRPSSVSPIVIETGEGQLDPHAIIGALAARGYRRILIEGGAATVSAFLAAGAVDRLHLSIAPIVIGSGPSGISLPPIDQLDAAMRPHTTVHHLGKDVLFDCVFQTSRAVPLDFVALNLVES